MNYDVISTSPFERQLKRLAKKHKSIKDDLKPIIEDLSNNPEMGTSLGKNCFKIRVAIGSKNRGKSGGGRIITYFRSHLNTVYLLDIYDKSTQATLSDKELKLLIDLLGDD